MSNKKFIPELTRMVKVTDTLKKKKILAQNNFNKTPKEIFL